MPVNLSYPKPKNTYVKFGSLSRTDTTAKELMVLQKGVLVTGLYVIGSAVSNAGTSASIGIGTTSDANQIMTGFDVKTAATGEGYVAAGAAAVGSAMAAPLTADSVIYGKYVEAGTASTSGGPWVIKVEYAVVGPNETITS
jgi:hypothetical protein